MSAYTPTDARTVEVLFVALAVVLAAGLGLSRLPRGAAVRAAAWALVVGSVFFAEHVTRAQPAGVRMLALIGLLLVAMKAVVSVEASGPRLSALRWLAFAAAWPGMRPAVFAGVGGPALEGGRRLLGMGAARIALGFALLAAGRAAWVWTGSPAAATVPLLAGLSLVLHFGVFNVVAGGWRCLGADATPLFKAPLLSKSLGEFWGRRWNLAFSEMTAIGVYRPVSAVAGRRVGLFAAFAASGVLHELAISLPVKAGYGLPMTYFAIHGGLVVAERALEARGRPISGHAALGRLWTIFWLVAPLPVLFHPPFLAGTMWPILGIEP